jgi:Fe2+ transport system protein B
MSNPCPPSACQTCSVPRTSIERVGSGAGGSPLVVALAGNPNTGKSTVFNRLTGLRQHTGNWPGKTIARAEGSFVFRERRYTLVDLPGTYSLRSSSPDETIAREFILFGRPDVTVMVADATCLERNLNLVLQILQITDRAVLCVNLMDEARANGIQVDARRLAGELGVPVVLCAARSGEGIDGLLDRIEAVATGADQPRPRRIKLDVPGLEAAVADLKARLLARFPGLDNSEWIALRLLEGDQTVAARVADGSLGRLVPDHASGVGR